MSVIFIGGYFDKEYEQVFIKHSKFGIENSANVFQRKLIAGFSHVSDDFVHFSAPLVGAYPQRCDLKYIKKKEAKDINYVSFNNIWGLRNISRKSALIREIDKKTDYSKPHTVVVYSAHTPFIEAAVHIKRKSPDSEICLIVPDLPQFMMLTNKIPLYYKVLKHFDVKKIYNLCKQVDSYVVLTDQMLDKLPDGRRKKSFIAEGIIDESVKLHSAKRNTEKTVVYCGKLEKAFGIMNLIEAFQMADDKNLKLIICGNGEMAEEIAKLRDKRIEYKGQVPADEAARLTREADILVNPRQNDMEYTKYSFPSKNIEYLSSGNAVVAYMLDGMKREYEKFLYCPENNTAEALSKSILKAANDSDEERKIKADAAADYLNRHLLNDKICERIVNMSNKK